MFSSARPIKGEVVRRSQQRVLPRYHPPSSLFFLAAVPFWVSVILMCGNKAIEDAVARRVHIICMSWSIESNSENVDDIQKLSYALLNAEKLQIILFCARVDNGAYVSYKQYPAAVDTKHIITIGAVTADRSGLAWAGDQAKTDFTCPGEDVLSKTHSQKISGSSIATALAAGLAAMILHCTRLAAIYFEMDSKAPLVTPEDFLKLKNHRYMVNALNSIGISDPGMLIEVWRCFGPAIDAIDAGGGAKYVIGKLVQNLLSE